MGKLFVEFDNWWFDWVFQPLVNRLIGLVTPLQLAVFFLVGNMLARIGVIFFDWRKGSFQLVALNVFDLGLQCWLYFMVNFLPLRRGRNPLRAAPLLVFLRIYCFFAFVLSFLLMVDQKPELINFLYTFVDVVDWLFLYLISCDLPPPLKKFRLAFWQPSRA